MRLQDVLPCGLFSAFVECYWYVEASEEESAAVPDAILPNGTSNLIFNLSGCPHREYEIDSMAEILALETRWFSGIRDTAVVVGPTVCTRVVGIRFKPGGLIPFTNVPAAEVARITINSDDLWGSDCDRLHQQLFEARHVAELFELLEDWLLARFHLRTAQDGILNSLGLLTSTAGNVTMTRLARSADLSTRQYRRRFEQAVGMTPKRLARILRFQEVIRFLAKCAAAPDWARIALRCGYFDQAHLIADFREFAGVSPGEYLRRGPVVPGFMPMHAPMSVFSNTGSGDSTRMATR